ncbi:DNA polymerase delta small subunit [Komagataella phaffii CBS 7435]|uniref:DNA-directed DNA polymerase n=2 Tax=Komagataella phaffii TaxID=460519 RepID=C4R0J2_KOMPG|nr:DNA polymerase III (delta) subunit, essential for cell viability [Komagataella phaffii GS115]AOA62285.1 GQ67_00436T0 [Komagataella phaffii]CAH2448466.1 DNA polymerase delta small subunit [Komagataella phaffii CBS 7435]AOA67143.1 GQ68_00953T0 [Komagataella phaffii GS115]CAY69016.1 DNA polymerase III (delta) subunit, essential for cell viability [Komagataella phaffii GS115]SCV12082.1 DNA polymerase delta small subunit [Komagataella phaffii CBS 7435]
MTMDQEVRRREVVRSSDSNKALLYTLNKNNRNYDRQYASIYTARANKLKPRLIEKCSEKWKGEKINGIPVSHTEKVLNISSNKATWCVGTVFCDLKYKPNILKDVSESMYGGPVVKKVDGTYADRESDQLMLEDESGRIALDGELIDKILLVTGCIVGVLGMEINPGVFTVVDIVYPEPGLQKPRLLSNHRIALVSGLGINGDNLDLSRLELLKEFLTGELLENQAQESSIAKLIIAGNSIKVGDLNKIHQDKKNKFKATYASNYNATAVSQLDNFIHDVIQTIPVDILPGAEDPAEIALPQQPLHKAFFNSSRQFVGNRLNTKTNPQWWDLAGTEILGTSGENIDDIFKYVVPNDYHVDEDGCENSRIKIIESTIRWQHILPTAPDTLWCYPYQDDDPFVLESTPHVYFVGNQARFESKDIILDNGFKVKLLSLPRFDQTGEVVILDLNDLSTNLVSFSV